MENMISECLALWAKLKSGDPAVWAEFQDTAIHAAQGDRESQEILSAMLAVLAANQIPCCASCAYGMQCESVTATPSPSPANKPLVGGCGCANKPLVGFCC
jgi:hypothetical protein